MRLLIHSNGPTIKTGYGVQCALLVERLHDEGHDVAVSCTYGQQGSLGKWRPDAPLHPELWPAGEFIRLYPGGYEVNSNDVIHNHALHWFGGDPLGGWIITLLDVWCLVNPLLAQFNIAAWTPVDHFPVPPGVLKFFERTDAVPVAMSKFGERLLAQAGLDSTYVPLAVDTEAYKPTLTLSARGQDVPGREVFDLPNEAFVVGMVAMNKDGADRKGFCEAFAAFGAFWRAHNDAVLFVHTSAPGMGTSFDLRELAIHCSIPEHAIKFSDEYAYRFGLPAEMMAAAYTAMDVLLAPSKGEGFCVPLIEAQSCGTPVIVTDFSAQPELVGAGWKVMGQQLWDPAQHAFYITPFVTEILTSLEEAWAADLDEMAPKAIEFAAQYDADRVFEEFWRPLLARMEATPEPLELVRDEPFEVAVIVPLMRPENIVRLTESFDATNDGTAELCFVIDESFVGTVPEDAGCLRSGRERSTYAEKVNLGFAETTEPWVLLVGDDVEFHEGWLSEARKLADRFDVIGTNDSLPMSSFGPGGYELVPGRIRNPAVASGQHADHFFVRRSYIEKYGACLDGPGVLAPECYRHFFVDKEIIELAKARGVFTPCLTSVVEHHHPAYDGKPRDDVYSVAIEHGAADKALYEDREPLIKMQRTSLGKTA